MSEQTTATEAYEGYAVLELMGHRVIGGRVSEVVAYGTPLCRIEVLDPSDDTGETVAATQYYGGSAIYCMTPATLEVALETNHARFDLPPIVKAALRKPAPLQPALPLHADWNDASDTLPPVGVEKYVCIAGLTWQDIAYYADDGKWYQTHSPDEPMENPPTHWRDVLPNPPADPAEPNF